MRRAARARQYHKGTQKRRAREEESRLVEEQEERRTFKQLWTRRIFRETHTSVDTTFALLITELGWCVRALQFDLCKIIMGFLGVEATDEWSLDGYNYGHAQHYFHSSHARRVQKMPNTTLCVLDQYDTYWKIFPLRQISPSVVLSGLLGCSSIKMVSVSGSLVVSPTGRVLPLARSLLHHSHPCWSSSIPGPWNLRPSSLFPTPLGPGLMLATLLPPEPETKSPVTTDREVSIVDTERHPGQGASHATNLLIGLIFAAMTLSSSAR